MRQGDATGPSAVEAGAARPAARAPGRRSARVALLDDHELLLDSMTAWLKEHTDLVPAIYWLAIGSVIAAFTLARAVESVLSARARRCAAQAALRPSWADSRPVKPRRQCGAAVVAFVRRLKYDQPRWLEKLCVGSIGHLLLLVFFLGGPYGASQHD